MTVTPTDVQPTAKPIRQEFRGPLTTKLGKQWADRIRVSDRYYEANCNDFDELLELYVSTHRLREGWNSNVSMGWSVLQNLVADSFFQNPEPVILALSPSREDQARMLVDIGRTWHQTENTEDNAMRARVLCGLQGGAVVWIDEDADYDDAVAYDDQTGEPMKNDAGEQLYELDEKGDPLKDAVRQDFKQSLIDLHGMRFDPDGRRWDWRDMKWVSRRYQKPLQEFLDDRAFSENAKAMLLRWSKQRDERRRGNMNWSYGREGYEEKDSKLQMIECDEVWSMAHGVIVHMPVGAEFHLEGASPETQSGFPMPDFWLRRKMYPGVMFAYKWHPPDKMGKKGFYPIPDLRLVKSQLKNLIRLEGLILNLCTQQTTKYLIQDGIIDNKVQRRVASDVPRELIPVDFIGVLKRLISAGVQVPSNLDSLIVNLKTEQREQLVKHFEAFTHEVDIIRETLSQGPSQRGGVPDSETATGQLQVGQALQRRLDIEAEMTSFFIDGLTERYFLLLQKRSTLPVPYRGMSDNVNDEVFRAFTADEAFRDLKLHFTHRTGSARGVDRELLRSQIREAITNALPVVQDPSQIQMLLKKLFATFDDPTLARAFDNDLSQLAEQAALLQQQVELGQVPLAVAGPQLLEFLSAFCNAHMTQAGIDRVAQQSAQGPAQGPAPTDLPPGGQQGSAPKPKTSGQSAFHAAAGLAAAGRMGGSRRGAPN